MAKRKVLPKGAGRVNCLDCGATAAADGKGSPIVLPHTEACLEKILAEEEKK